MADAPLHQASRIGAVVPRCTTFLVFWDFLHICEGCHAHASASHAIIAVDHHARPKIPLSKVALVYVTTWLSPCYDTRETKKQL